jgi:hypothetical protein
MMHNDEGHSVVSRRALLTAAAAATATAPLVTEGFVSSAAAVPRARVTPTWTEALRRTYGVGVLPTDASAAYAHVDDWTRRLADLGAFYIRGRYQPGTAQTTSMIRRCRALRIKWLMSIIPENWSMSEEELRAVLVHIRDNAADLCIGVEGMNQPNDPPIANWPQRTVGYQRVIKTFLDSTPALSRAVSVGPSLHNGTADTRADFLALRDAGLAQYIDFAGLHSYPSGGGPATYVDERLRLVREAWGNVPTWVTETGYNTALGFPLNGDEGPKPVPQDVAAIYGPRSVLEWARRGCKAARFQLLDEVNPANDVPNENYGLIENTGNVPTTWTPKQEFGAMRSFLALLRDPVRSYTPPPFSVGVAGPSDLRWIPVGKSDGSRALLMYRGARVWNPTTRTRITVNTVDVRITDRLGTRVVKVGPSVVMVRVR